MRKLLSLSVSLGVIGEVFARNALALMDQTSLDAAVDAVGPAIPEPGAALLFFAGAGLLAWSRRKARS